MNIRRLAVALALLFPFLVLGQQALVSPQPAQTTYLKREMRGAWIATVVNLDWPSSPGLTPSDQRLQLVNLLDGLAAAGINAVIFQVRTECDALYNSPYEPWSYWLTGVQGTPPSPYYDPLEFAISESHKRGMELHAWFNPYRAVRPSSYTRAATHVSVQHPEMMLTFNYVASNGQPATLKILNPGLSETRNHVARVVSDIMRRYDVDGIHADDYFYPYPDGTLAGITTEDTATFRLYPREFAPAAGANYPDTSYVNKLKSWRRDNVNLLIKQIYDSLQAVKPWIKFGMSPFGIWQPGNPTGITGLNAYNTIYCDALAWLNGQYIDYLTPQLYWPFGGSQDYGLLQPWWAQRMNGRHLYTGNATYRLTLNPLEAAPFASASEIANQIRFNRQLQNAHGSIQFRAKSILQNYRNFLDTLKNDLFLVHSFIPSMAWKEQIPPNAPSNLQSVPIPNTPLSALAWTAPAPASDGDTARRYAVYRFPSATVSGSDIDNPNNIVALNGVPSAVPGVNLDAPGIQYYYSVVALDKNNNESTISNLASIVGSASTPSLALPADGGLFSRGGAVRWNRAPDALVYRLQIAIVSDFGAGSIVASTQLSDTSFIPNSLQAQQSYYWRVFAGNQSGSSALSETRSFNAGWPLTPIGVKPIGIQNVPLRPTFAWSKGVGTSFRILVTRVDSGNVLIDQTVLDSTFTPNVDLPANKLIAWKVSAANEYGSSDLTAEYRFKTQAASLVENLPGSPVEFALSRNYPNPFNPTTALEVRVASDSRVVLKVFDLLGRELRTLLDDQLPQGVYRATFDGSAYPSGTYFAVLNAGGVRLVTRMLLLK